MRRRIPASGFCRTINWIWSTEEAACHDWPILDDDAFQDFEYFFAYSCPRKSFQHVTLKIDTFMMWWCSGYNCYNDLIWWWWWMWCWFWLGWLIEKNVDYQRVLKVFCLNQVRTFCRGSTIFHQLTFKVDELQSVVKMIFSWESVLCKYQFKTGNSVMFLSFATCNNL